MNNSKFSKFASITAALAMAILPVAAQAQQAQDQSDSEPQLVGTNPLGIPADATFFAQPDPNVRSATAKVNGSIITGTDIAQRVALVLAASPNRQLSDEELQTLRMQVLRNLIDETIQIQAATAQEMEVTKDEVEARYQALAQQNFPENPKAMDEYLTRMGSSPAALKRQIEGEIAWSLLIRRNVSPFINVSTEEVNEIIEQLRNSRGQYEYRLAEIYLSATPENAATVQQNAARIIEQIRNGGSFQAYARQFSESTTAAVGGDLGFVRLATLPTEMAEAAQTLDVGQLVGPVQIPGGYVIIVLLDKKQVLTADPRDAVLSLKQIAIGFEPGESQEKANERVQKFAQAVSTIRGCGDAQRAADLVDASVVDNNSIAVRDLPEQMQATMLQMKVGEATPPFGSLEDGVRVLMLCGRDDPEAIAEPDFNQIRNELEDQRISKRAQRYLRDLRNDAIIEYN